MSLRIVFILLFLTLTQAAQLASSSLFAQNFGSARGPASRTTVSPSVDSVNPSNPSPSIAPTLRTFFDWTAPAATAPSVGAFHEIPRQERDFSDTERKVAIQWNKSVTPQNTVSETQLANATWNPASDPHPAVTRIIAFDKGGQTHVFGSGTYISAHGQYGIVVTNWHVVRDSFGLVQVHFPDGFASYAAIISYDSTWDLTALMISKPEVSPVTIAKTAPKKGDPLWIAGYGSGKYRLVGGLCTQYITPEIGLRNEFVELSVEARQGDSGGPIFNQKGELAGVLFGSDNRNTAGSFCGRVRYFLEQSQKRINSVPAEPEKLFATIEPGLPQHKLDKGAELFRSQVAQSMLTNKDFTNSRTGRGSASSREVSTPNSAERSTVRPGQITYYPNFPDFTRPQPVQVQPQPQPIQTAKPDGQRLTLHETPATAEIRADNASSVTRQQNPQPPVRQTAPVRVAAAPEEETYRFSEPSERIAMSVPPQMGAPFFSDHTGEQVSGVFLPEETLTESHHSGSFFSTLKIIAAIFVVFFVVFHLVKLMSIIEEN